MKIGPSNIKKTIYSVQRRMLMQRAIFVEKSRIEKTTKQTIWPVLSTFLFIFSFRQRKCSELRRQRKWRINSFSGNHHAWWRSLREHSILVARETRHRAGLPKCYPPTQACKGFRKNPERRQCFAGTLVHIIFTIPWFGMRYSLQNYSRYVH